MAIEIIKDIVYGEGSVGFNAGAGPVASVPLTFDAFLPENAGTGTGTGTGTGAPALVLAFGGAFHRGSKENDAFSDGVGTSTAMAEYCRRFAESGMPCFSVQYRLGQADAAPVAQPVLRRPEGVSLGRAAIVREMLGLGPITPLGLARVMEAAFEDVANATRFIIAHAARYGVDAERVVVGGFSAGARCAMYAAYAKQVPVAGVVSISGPMMAEDAAHYVTAGRRYPPLLYVEGEKDLEQVMAISPAMRAAFQHADVAAMWRRVPGGTHFYPAEAKTDRGETVFEAIAAALKAWGCAGSLSPSFTGRGL